MRLFKVIIRIDPVYRLIKEIYADNAHDAISHAIADVKAEGYTVLEAWAE